MIDAYLNQIVTWKPNSGFNEAAEPISSTSQMIKVRWENRRKLVRDLRQNNRDRQEVISEAFFFCKEDVKPGDIVVYDNKEWFVITVDEIPDLNGVISHREVSV